MLLAPFVASLLIPSPSSTLQDVPPRGAYVEARTASVYAGACHYGGEATTAGREALLGWSVEGGSFGGVDLAGAKIAVAIRDDANLADGPRARRSVVYVDAGLSAARQDAACRWLASVHADVLGAIEAVRSVDLVLAIDAQGYALRAQGYFTLEGAPMPDRACCKMPFNVWYEPFESLEHALVGNDAAFRFEDRALGLCWSRPNENAAFVGRFGAQ